MNDHTAAEWLTDPALTAKLAAFKADRERVWRIVDTTFDERIQCLADNQCPWLSVHEGRRGNTYACDLRNYGNDVMDCRGVEAAAREEIEE